MLLAYTFLLNSHFDDADGRALCDEDRMEEAVNHWLDTHFPGALGDDPSDRLDLETALCHLVELGLAEKHDTDASDGAEEGTTESRVMYKAIPFEVALEAAYAAARESIDGVE